MNFFEHQVKAKQNTTLLIFYFALAVAGIVAAVNLVTVGYITFGNMKAPPQLYQQITIGVLVTIALGTVIGMIKLGTNGATIAKQMGGVQIHPATQNADERRLMNVVEEMSIASGIMVPPVYILPDSSINAFAAGLTPNKAVIAVTRGTVRNLDRDELQAVVAHEFSHIFNGDMRLNVRLIGLLHGILMITVIGRLLMRTRGKRNPLPVLGLLLFVVGWIGVFVSRIIKSAVSRQRELLADASAVQFTRNPSGLRDALIKIKSLGSIVENPKTEEISHMFFVKGFAGFFDSLLASHPPIDERLRAIDASYRPDQTATAKPARAESLASAGVSAFSAPAAAPKPVPAPMPATVIASIAAPTKVDVAQAVSFRESIPPKIAAWLTETSGAKAIVYATLLSNNAAMQVRQLEMLRSREPACVTQVNETHDWIKKSQLAGRLPLVIMAISALRLLQGSDLDVFLQIVGHLIQIDNRTTPFEFAVDVVLERALKPQALPATHGPLDVRASATGVLSYLAYAGAAGNVSAADAAFRKAHREIDAASNKAILPWETCGPAETRTHLFQLTKASPQEKQKIVAALAACTLADAVVKPEEWETLRVVCAVLDCPAPFTPPS